ncbi:MAG: ROK family transcriptional regulator [Anaerolineaceae bacterium]|nr:ROK family transcriptional regulator [Anaerolineaceae bacterium]
MPEQAFRNPGAGRINLSEDEAVILHSLFQSGPKSRADLAREVYFSRSKVNDLVGKLLSRGILQEIQRNGQGKWMDLSVNPNLGYLVGIDLGTTSVDVGLADCSCVMLDRLSATTDVNEGPEVVLGEAVRLLETLLAQYGVREDQLMGIGVGVPGPVNYPSGEVIGGQFTPGWEGFKIQEIIGARFPGVVIRTDNDANLMAMGSHQAGMAKDSSDFVFVKVGTGIGSGVYCRGQLHRGFSSCAGHIGHTCVDFNGPVCRCGNRGCLEAFAGGPGIAVAAEEAVAAGESEILRSLKEAHGGVLTAVEVGEAAAMRDPAALQIIRRTGTLIGTVLAGVINLYNPELIVIGGGISKIGNLLLAEIRREVLKRAYSYTTMGLQIEYSPIVDDVGVIGAVHCARDGVFAVDGENISEAGSN